MGEAAKTEEGKTTPITMADIRKMVTDTVTEVTKSLTPAAGKEGESEETARPGTRAERGANVAAQVQAEIDRIKAKEAQEARDKTIDEQLASLTEKTTEKAPVERGKMHRFMGWGE